MDGIVSYVKNKVDTLLTQRVYRVIDEWNTSKTVTIPAGLSLITADGRWWNSDVDKYIVVICKKGANNNISTNILAYHDFGISVQNTELSITNSSADAPTIYTTIITI